MKNGEKIDSNKKILCPCESCDCVDCEGCEGYEHVKPTLGQLYMMSWAVLWRYLVVGLLIMAAFMPFYMMRADFMMNFFQGVNVLKDISLASGYMAAFDAHPGWIITWFLARIIVGYLITYWIFTQILYRDFNGFSLQMKTTKECKEACMKKGMYGCPATNRIAWAFYWRLLVFMIVYFALIIWFVPPEVLVSNYGLIMLLSIVVFYFVMTLVFSRLFNRMYGHHRCPVHVCLCWCRKKKEE